MPSSTDLSAAVGFPGSAAGSALGRGRATGTVRRWHQDRDRAARDELVDRFLPLARKLARRYAGRTAVRGSAAGSEPRAAEGGGPLRRRRGTAFSSFAVPTILGELKRYFRDLGWSAHVPRGAQELALKVHAPTTSSQRRPGARRPSPSLRNTWSSASRTYSRDSRPQPRTTHPRSTPPRRRRWRFRIADRHVRPGRRRTSLVEDATRSPPRCRRCQSASDGCCNLLLRGRTQREIAEQIGVSQMQISRILRGAITRLDELQTLS